MNPVANKYIRETNKGYLGITGHFTGYPLPPYIGGIFNSGFSEGTNYLINEMRKTKSETENKKE